MKSNNRLASVIGNLREIKETNVIIINKGSFY